MSSHLPTIYIRGDDQRLLERHSISASLNSGYSRSKAAESVAKASIGLEGDQNSALGSALKLRCHAGVSSQGCQSETLNVDLPLRQRNYRPWLEALWTNACLVVVISSQLLKCEWGPFRQTWCGYLELVDFGVWLVSVNAGVTAGGAVEGASSILGERQTTKSVRISTTESNGSSLIFLRGCVRLPRRRFVTTVDV